MFWSQGGTLIAVGLGVAAAGFAGKNTFVLEKLFQLFLLRFNIKTVFHVWTGRYAFQLWKPLGQVFSETVKKMPTAVSSTSSINLL